MWKNLNLFQLSNHAFWKLFILAFDFSSYPPINSKGFFNINTKILIACSIFPQITTGSLNSKITAITSISLPPHKPCPGWLFRVPPTVFWGQANVHGVGSAYLTAIAPCVKTTNVNLGSHAHVPLPPRAWPLPPAPRLCPTPKLLLHGPPHPAPMTLGLTLGTSPITSLPSQTRHPRRTQPLWRHTRFLRRSPWVRQRTLTRGM